MLHGAVRTLFQLLGALVAGLVIALTLVGWRLTSAPIELDFLTPHIEEALSAKDGSFAVALDGTVLALSSGSGRMVEMRALGAKVYAGGEMPVASVPEVALTLNGRALLMGVIAPGSVTLYRPEVRLVRDEAGNLQFEMGGGTRGSGDGMRRVIDALMGEPDPSQPGRHLQRAAIIDADLQVEDLALGVSWHASDADIQVQRTVEGLSASIHLELDLASEPGYVDGELEFVREDESFDGRLSVRGLRPASLARLGGPLAPLKALDVRLAGTVWARGFADGRLEEVSFDVAGGQGEIDLTEDLGFRHTIASASVRGAIFDGLNRARLDELFLDLGGPTIMLAATADRLDGGIVLKADAVVREAPFNALPQLWPPIVAPNARDWVVSNMSDGKVVEARATVSARSDSGGLDDLVIDHVDGTLDGEGVTVDYLRPMPAVRNGSASASFDASEFRIVLKAGEVYGLKVVDGLVILSGLDAEDQFADIDVTIAGPAADGLRLIDNKPLGYAKALGIEPATVSGSAVTRLQLKFPLLKDLLLDDVGILAKATLTDLKVPKVVMGLDLTDGDLDMVVDAKGLDASGPVVLGTIPGQLTWRENFSLKGSAFRSRYRLQAPVVDEDQRKLLGLGGPPFVSPFLSGPVAADVVATLTGGGKGEISAVVDLSPARMRLPGLGWRKEERTTGGAEILLRLEKLKLAAIPAFTVQAGDLQAKGAVSFHADGSTKRVDFDRLAYGRTDVSGAIAFRRNDGMDISLRGTSFNAEPLIGSDSDEDRADELEDQRNPDTPTSRSADLPPMSVTMAVNSMWVSKNGAISNATASLHRDATEWRSIAVKGMVGDNGGVLSMDLRQNEPGRRAVAVLSDDAGAVARAFDVYDDMLSGKLEIDGFIDDTKPSQPISGLIRVEDYRIRNAPALARLLTVAALTGIVDLLNAKEGITFTTLDAPFTLADGLLEMHDVRAFGPALGLTAKGQVDLDRSRMALEGTVVPAYAINSVLGNIPILGWLITGGEKGGGLLAFNYSMRGPTQEPDVTVNPLSALTPGFLRNLFNIFDDGTGTEAR